LAHKYELRSWPFWSLRGESLSGTVGGMNAPRATAAPLVRAALDPDGGR